MVTWLLALTTGILCPNCCSNKLRGLLEVKSFCSSLYLEEENNMFIDVYCFVRGCKI